MAAAFSWRRTQPGDLAECLALRPAKNGAEQIGHAAALRAWKEVLAASWACRSSVVERRVGARVEIVGFGLGLFVTKAFAAAELKHPRPGLNTRIIESVVRGESVAASYEEVRDANTACDLQQVILDTSWKDEALTPGERDEVRVILGMSYMDLFGGYRFSLVLTEAVDELDLWHNRGHRAFRIVDRFQRFYREHPGTRWNKDRGLAAATVESMRSDPGSIAAGLFQHHSEPQFGFARGEQELLESALEGADDTAAAAMLFVSLPAIKRRWAKLFERVAAIQPEICLMDGEGVRGSQKRNRVVAYVRSHPEELRPYRRSAGGSRLRT